MLKSFVLLFFIGQFSGIFTDFVCRNMVDANWFDYEMKDKENTVEKLKALEEQVRQIQDIVTSGKYSEKNRRFPGIPSDCGEIYADGTRQDGVYLISPDGRCPFKVYCDMTNGGWTVIQRRIDGTVNFYRKWDEYVEGFGDIDGEHWLGLEKIHRLTKDGNQIYFDIGNYDGTTDYAHYKSFAVDGVTTLYKLHVDAYGFEGSLGELFTFHNHQKFSTFDRDNDSHGSNCASDLDGGAWWYKNCYRLGNLNGVFGKMTNGGLGYWKNKNVPIKTATIRVKPANGQC